MARGPDLDGLTGIDAVMGYWRYPLLDPLLAQSLKDIREKGCLWTPASRVVASTPAAPKYSFRPLMTVTFSRYRGRLPDGFVELPFGTLPSC